MPFTTDGSPPDAEWVYDNSRLRWNRYGVTSADDLVEPLEDAIGYITWITGRYFAGWLVPSIGDPSAYDPRTGYFGTAPYGPVSTPYTPVAFSDAPELIRQAWRAVRLRVEQNILQDQPGYAETAADDLTQSFTAGPYSESRRDTSQIRGGRYASRILLNSDPRLNDLLTLLMTDERREYWNSVTQSGNVPAFQAEEVDWSLVGKSPLWPSAGGLADSPYPSIGNFWE